MTHTLRAATEDDFDQVLAWRREAYRGYVDRWFGGWDEAHEREHLRMRWGQRDVQILVLQGRDVGVLDTATSDAEILLGNVIVGSEHRGRGLGRAVVQDLLDEAAARGLDVRLKVFPDNPARELYARLGFNEESRTEHHVLMRWTPGDAATKPERPS